MRDVAGRGLRGADVQWEAARPPASEGPLPVGSHPLPTFWIDQLNEGDRLGSTLEHAAPCPFRRTSTGRSTGTPARPPRIDGDKNVAIWLSQRPPHRTYQG